MPCAITNVSETKISEFKLEILDILLTDKTTRRKIIWATDDYKYLGAEYDSKYPITPDLITGIHTDVIQPRNAKARQSQTERKKEKAEVFTPAWLCNEQNNLIDDAWFGKSGVFNQTEYQSWKATTEPVVFEQKKGKMWKDYVDLKRLEITCGEAPYLTSRYDMATGVGIPIEERIGLLDRKLRVVNENANNEEEWKEWAFRALESIYGFEYQGDSLLIARKNILYTFIENMKYKYNKEPSIAELRRAANIIAWNLWQMDGLSFTVPYGTISEQYEQLAILGLEKSKEEMVFCKIHDWRAKETIFYCSLIKEK